MKVDPVGSYLYASDLNNDQVHVFSINTSTGALTAVAGSPFATGVGPCNIDTSPDGGFIYVANYSGGTVSAFVLDRATGGLTPLVNSPFASGSTQCYGITVVE